MTAKSPRRFVGPVLTVGTVWAIALTCCVSCAPSGKPAAGESLDIALFSQPQGAVVPLVYGVDNYGGDFDLTISVDQNVTIFESHKTLIDTASAGNIQVMATSMSAILDAREGGKDLKIFCPYVGSTTSCWPVRTA